MTKPWVMDGRARASQVYRDTHARLAAEILRMRRAASPAKGRGGAYRVEPVQMSLFELAEARGQA